MEATPTAARQALGRAARERARRSSHRTAGEFGRDVLALLRADSAGSPQALAALRFRRMADSPFAFFCGSARVQAHDLGRVPDTGLVIPICGDSHLMNFGGFETPERQTVFDIEHFDETVQAPFEWDLKRLAASLVLAARQLRLSRGSAADFVIAAVNEYRERTAQYAQLGVLELWCERTTFDRMIETALAPERRRIVRRGLERAAGRLADGRLDQLVERREGGWTLDAPPPEWLRSGEAAPLLQDDWTGAGDWRLAFAPLWARYLAALEPERRELLDAFSGEDLVVRTLGASGAGARCFVLLLVDHREQPLFLQIREARESALARYVPVPASAPRGHAGERIVRGQRRLQAVADVFLGWTDDAAGRPFYIRQLRERRLAADLDLFDSALLGDYARLCGWSLARSHARAGGQAVEIRAYIGRNNQFAEALADYAAACADQAERDYEVFVKACRKGELPVEPDGADTGAA